MKVGATTQIAGVDGCKAGWIAVTCPADAPERAEAGVFKTMADLLAALPTDSIVAVDMPIGLPDRAVNGGRQADWAARKFLGRRQACVFPVPSRRAVYAFADGYAHACAVARETSVPPRAPSKQAYWIFPRIQEIDTLLRRDPPLRNHLFEVHPEVAFSLMNGGPILEPKKARGRGHDPGLQHRKTLLEQHGFVITSLEARLPPRVGLDDLLDACACAWSAARIVRGEARVFPDAPGTDAHGLPVVIWA